MAEDSEMRRSVFLVAGALTKLAESQGWKESDYRIYYRTNPDWGKVHFIFVVEAFNGKDPYETTRRVWAYLEKELKECQDVLSSLGLVVRSKEQVDEGGIYAIGSEYKEYWTLYPSATS
jgi:hypothetical protein